MVREIVRIIRRRWLWIFLTMVIAVASLEIWVLLAAPKQFEAVTTLRVSRLDLTPAVTDTQGLESTSWERDLLSRDSFKVAAQILTGEVESFFVESFPHEYEYILGTVLDELLSNDNAKPREQFVSELEAAVSIVASKQGGFYEIRARAHSEERAVLYSRLAAEASRVHLKRAYQHKIKAVVDTLRERELQLQSDLDDAIKTRIDSAKKLGIAEPSQRRELLQKLLLKTEEEMHELESLRLEISHIINRDEFLRHGEKTPPEKQAEGESTEPQNEGETISVAGGIDLQDELVRAKLEYEVRSTELSDQHPRVVRLKERVWQLESLLAARKKREVSTQTSMNTNDRVTDDLVDEYRMLTLRLENLNNKKDHLFEELIHLQELQPRLEKYEERAKELANKLELVRAQVDELERFLGTEPSIIHIERPADHARLISVLGSGWIWRLSVALGAFLIGLAMAWVLDLLDTRFHSDRDVQLFLQLPLLAVVPKLARREIFDLGYGAEARPIERFNVATTLLHSVGKELDMKTFAIASANAGEGKTVVSLHVAAALARKGLRVALIDADLRRPQLHNLLGVGNDIGLSTLLESNGQTQEIFEGQMLTPFDEEGEGTFNVLEVLQETPLENLYVLTSGPLSRSPIAAIEGPYMSKVMADFREIMDYVIIDTPSVMEAGESLSLAARADGCLLVIAAGQCESGDALWVKHLFENVQASILGVVLNRCTGDFHMDSISRLEQSLMDKEKETA